MAEAKRWYKDAGGGYIFDTGITLDVFGRENNLTFVIKSGMIALLSLQYVPADKWIKIEPVQHPESELSIKENIKKLKRNAVDDIFGWGKVKWQ